MSWYRAGTVTVAAGSNVVTGVGTDFVSNVSIGEAFIGPDGRSYEISQIVSATELRLTTVYGSGQGYAIQPTESFVRDLVLSAGNLLNTFAAVRDGVGQGMFGDGSAATPAVRFAADQDTGLRRLDANRMSLVAGGVDTLIIGIEGVQAPRPFVSDLALSSNGPRAFRIESTLTNASDVQVQIVTPNRAWHIGQNVGGTGPGTLNFYDVSSGAARMTLDNTGNLLVGTASGANHIIAKAVAQGSTIFNVSSTAAYGGTCAVFAGVSGYSPNGSGAAFYLGHNTATQRSINASGTINGSGADYAEYMLKAAGCGIIAKGDVCGVDRDGKLTTTWAEAISFVVKSTDPCMVGGDAWAAHLPPRPEGPGNEPVAPVKPGIAPVGPVEPGSEPTEEGPVYVAWLKSRFAFAVAQRDYLLALAEWQAATDAYPAAQAAYEAAHVAWVEAKAAYVRDLPAWEAQLESVRQMVDRIAFCGQVPCNVSGDFEVGDYIIPVQDGAAIKAVAVKDDDSLTDRQYRRRIGKVWAIRDGRAWVDVQHG